MHLIFSCSLIYFSSNPSKPTLNHQQSLQSRNSTSTLTDSRTKELEAHLREKEKDLRNKNTKIGKKSSVSSWNEACFRPNRTTKSRRRWSMSRVGAKDTQDRVCNKRVLAKPGRKPQENIHLWSRTFFAQIKGTLQSYFFLFIYVQACRTKSIPSPWSGKDKTNHSRIGWRERETPIDTWLAIGSKTRSSTTEVRIHRAWKSGKFLFWYLSSSFLRFEISRGSITR